MKTVLSLVSALFQHEEIYVEDYQETVVYFHLRGYSYLARKKFKVILTNKKLLLFINDPIWSYIQEIVPEKHDGYNYIYDVEQIVEIMKLYQGIENES